MFTVKLTGINSFKAEFTAATKDIEEICEQEVDSMAKRWVAGAKRDAPGVQHELANSISYLKSGAAAEIFANVFYAPFVEFGTKGNYRPIPGMEQIAAEFKGQTRGDIKEMLRAIVKWVGRKGLTGRYSVKTRKRLGTKVQKQDEDLKAAWPIMMSILKNGIRPHPYFFKQQEVVWPEMVRNIERRLKQKTKVAIIMPGDVLRPKIITI